MGEGNSADEETEARSSGDREEERNQLHSQQRTRHKEQNPTSTMSIDPNNDGTEGKEASNSGGAISSTPQNPEAKATPFSRCYSEQAARTPNTKRKLQKSYSAMHPMPLKSGIKMCLLRDDVSKLFKISHTHTVTLVKPEATLLKRRCSLEKLKLQRIYLTRHW